jgi:hypothetical protein
MQMLECVGKTMNKFIGLLEVRAKLLAYLDSLDFGIQLPIPETFSDYTNVHE